MAKSIYVFYGFSGDRGKTPKFPNGVDNDKSFKLVAETLAGTLKKLHPTDTIHVRQTWTKNKIIDELEAASDPIRQVHLSCHGDSTMLSLAYKFDRGKRLKARARKFNGMTGTDRDRALKAMKEEDGLVAGFFEHGLEKKRLAKIKGNHANDASWQIWGCYAGYDSDVFEGIGDPEVDPYFKRFNLGKSDIPGVAIDIAKQLKVRVTAAIDGAGLEFWHGEKGKKVIINDKKTPAKNPYWLWNAAGSKWVSYDSSGTKLSRPEMFHVARDTADLPTPKPPKWLTDLYWASP